jgi:hypothetical protein
LMLGGAPGECPVSCWTRVVMIKPNPTNVENIQDNAPFKQKKPRTCARVLPVVHREARISREEERADEFEGSNAEAESVKTSCGEK